MISKAIRLALLAAPVLFAGCDTLVDPNGTIAQLQQVTGNERENPEFLRAAQAGGALLQIGLVERDLQTAVVLETRRDGIDTWRSVDGAALITENGMLRGTRGLAQVWLSSDVSQPLKMVTRLLDGQVERFHSYLDGEDQVVTRSYVCDIDTRGPRDVNLGVRVAQTVLMRETCYGLDDEFFNLYWVENGRIIQSRQWGGAEVGAISTRIVEG